MTDLVLFILFVLSGQGGFNPADVPEPYRMLDKSGAVLTEDEVVNQCSGACYDYWRQEALKHEEALKEGGALDFLGVG